MKVLICLAATALLVLPVQAGVQVDHEPGVDFSGLRTFAWKSGTVAARPEVQRWIVDSVERELTARGIRKVTDRRADLYVVTHAYAQMDNRMRGNYLHVDVLDVGIITADVVGTTTGTLLVDLLHGDSDQPVWRGMATEVMGVPDTEKIRKKVEKVVKKMFKKFPRE